MPVEPILIELPPAHLREVRAQLESAGLPHDDIDAPGRRFYRLEVGGAPVGWAGLEACGADALLRSIVIADHLRGQSQGRLLVSSIAAEARQLGVERLWLLTTTAAAFFAKLGFDTVRREAAPAAIQASREFASICPASATCMMVKLKDDPQ
jgi:amino-acid N-acetyltransferase